MDAAPVLFDEVPSVLDPVQIVSVDRDEVRSIVCLQPCSPFQQGDIDTTR